MNQKSEIKTTSAYILLSITKGDDAMAKGDTYKEIRTFKFPGMTVNVYIPDLTKEEGQRRMHHIYNAAASLLKEEERIRKG